MAEKDYATMPREDAIEDIMRRRNVSRRKAEYILSFLRGERQSDVVLERE